jgi:hypothetical protein
MKPDNESRPKPAGLAPRSFDSNAPAGRRVRASTRSDFLAPSAPSGDHFARHRVVDCRRISAPPCAVLISVAARIEHRRGISRRLRSAAAIKSVVDCRTSAIWR